MQCFFTLEEPSSPQMWTTDAGVSERGSREPEASPDVDNSRIWRGEACLPGRKQTALQCEIQYEGQGSSLCLSGEQLPANPSVSQASREAPLLFKDPVSAPAFPVNASFQHYYKPGMKKKNIYYSLARLIGQSLRSLLFIYLH